MMCGITELISYVALGKSFTLSEPQFSSSIEWEQYSLPLGTSIRFSVK